MIRKSAGPTLADEIRLWQNNFDLIFGIDEAGRGCLAGPVYAAAVAWDKRQVPPEGIRDSKQLTEARRAALFDQIQAGAACTGIGSASNIEIDRWNILEATALAVARALEQALAGWVLHRPLPATDRIAYLVDGKLSLITRARFFAFHKDFCSELPLLRSLLRNDFHEECFIKGDSRSLSIAAGSVLAKVSRDRWMVEMDSQYPQYEFRIHKGYFTARHRELLEQNGPCREHRFSFAPVRDCRKIELQH